MDTILLVQLLVPDLPRFSEHSDAPIAIITISDRNLLGGAPPDSQLGFSDLPA